MLTRARALTSFATVAVRSPTIASAQAIGTSAVQTRPDPDLSHPEARRRLYHGLARSLLPRLWTLADTNPWRSTFGSFDREYWHYRTADFPCGMQQEAALALALACSTRVGGSRWYGLRRARELAVAAVEFAARSARSNGALDDYYPYEQAVGATAFCLRAAAVTRKLLDIRSERVDRWLQKAARWLLEHRETGFLANHEALVCLAVTLVGQQLGCAALIEGARRRLQELLERQSPEGWFPEYGGCDPGYHTVLVAFLADLWRRTGWPELQQPLERAVTFAAAVQHPDGTFGGEYGSRNTFHCYAHGFELLAHLPDAQTVLRKLAAGIARGRVLPPEDDRMIAHYGVDRLLAALDCQHPLSERETDEAGRSGLIRFPDAGLIVLSRPPLRVVVGLSKGGVLKAYRGETLILSDTGLVVELNDRTIAGTCIGRPERVVIDQQGCEIEGWFREMRHPLISPFKQVLFRVANLIVGRLSPNALRYMLQRLAITGQRHVGVRFRRRIHWDGPMIIHDTIEWTGDCPVARLWLSTNATSMYVAASDHYQPGVRHAWTDVTDRIPRAREATRCEIRRVVCTGT